MTTGLLSLAGVVIGSLIARGFGRGFSREEMDFLFPTPRDVQPPSIAELNA